jgi:hypothetical protein
VTVGRILVNGADHGSGFALDARLVVTANHVIGASDAAALQFETDAGRTLKIEQVDRDVDLDVAVLRVAEDLTEVFAVGRAVQGAKWAVETQPLGNDPRLDGTITVLRRKLQKSPGHFVWVMQLQVEQELGNYGGYSGSPVLLDSPEGGVIGVLDEQVRMRLTAAAVQPPPAANVLYAIPIADVVQRFALHPSVAEKLARRADFYKHIAQPVNFVPRPEVLQTVREALLTARRADPPEHVTQPIVFAFEGMGGTGKSVVARALCDDPLVQAAFSGGILWTTIGLGHPDLVSKLRDWIGALGGTVSQGSLSIDGLRAQLADLLTDRTCLLILDDVWQHTHADAFRVSAPTSCMLLTTRDSDVALALDAQVVHIPLMTDPEALELLARWADDSVQGADPDGAHRVVERLGLLPLAVKLAGTQLRRWSPTEWFERYDEVRDVALLSLRRVEDVHDSLEWTFNLSFEQLDATTKTNYAALSIFRQDEAILEAPIARLWHALGGLPRAAAAEILDDLASRALLDIDEKEQTRTVALHDLLHDFLSKQFVDRRLEAHAKLLDSYRLQPQPSQWHAVADDGYLYDHLVYHLDVLSADEELHRLFSNDRWLHARFSQRGYAYDGYLADLGRVQILSKTEASSQIQADEPPAALADCARWALIQASIVSVAGNFAFDLVARAVETGLWTPERGMSVAATIGHTDRRARMYVSLLRTGSLTASQEQECQRLCLDAVFAIRDDSPRESTLESALDVLPDDMIEYAVTSAVAAADPEFPPAALLITALARLQGEPREDLAQRAVLAVQAMRDDNERVHTFVALIQYLRGRPRETTIERAVDSAHHIAEHKNRAHALAALARVTSTPQKEVLLRSALAAAAEVDDPKEHVYALAAIASASHEQACEAILLSALEMLPQIRDARERAYALKALVPRSQIVVPDRTAQAVAEMPFGQWNVFAMISLLGQTPGASDESQQRHALHAVTELSDERERGWLLSQLAVLLSESLLDDYRAAAHGIGDEMPRIEALIPLAERCGGELRLRIVDDALQAVEHMKPSPWTERDRSGALRGLAPLLTGAQIERALPIALAMDEDSWRSETLAVLAPRLTGALLEQALDPARTIRDHSSQASALAYLAGQVPKDRQPGVVRTVLDIVRSDQISANPRSMAQLLAPLAESVDEEARAIVLELALDWVLRARSEAQSGRDELDPLAVIAPCLTEALRDRCVTSLLSDAFASTPEKGPVDRAGAIEAVAPYLNDTQVERIVHATDGYPLAQRPSIVKVIGPRLAPARAERLIRETFAATQAAPDAWPQLWGLVQLGPLLRSDERDAVMRDRVLEVARALEPEPRRWLVDSLAPYLPIAVHHQALELTSDGTDTWPILHKIVSQAALPGQERQDAQRALLITMATLERGPPPGGVWILEELAPQLETPLVEVALTEVLEFAWDESRSDGLVALAAHLSTQQLVRAFAAARKLEDTDARHAALIALVEHCPDELITLGIEALEAEEEWHPGHVEILKKLAPRLAGDLLDRAVNLSFRAPYFDDQSTALANLLPYVVDQTEVLNALRSIALAWLEIAADPERKEILELFANDSLFQAPVVEPETLAAIAGHIVDICQLWHWP